ncbi:MAG: YceI family protein [bacterium]
MAAKFILPAVALAIACLTGSALAARYQIKPGEGCRVVFKSKAPLESFEGRTDRVSGWFSVDLADLAAGVQLEVEVELATFDTGLGKRNQHMRENHLETDTYPVGRFSGGTVESPSRPVLTAGEPVTLQLTGTMDLHGMTLPMTVPVTLDLGGDGAITVTSEFVLKLSDFAIERPRFLVMKVADEQKIEVILTAERQPS